MEGAEYHLLHGETTSAPGQEAHECDEVCGEGMEEPAHNLVLVARPPALEWSLYDHDFRFWVRVEELRGEEGGDVGYGVVGAEERVPVGACEACTTGSCVGNAGPGALGGALEECPREVESVLSFSGWCWVRLDCADGIGSPLRWLLGLAYHC